MNINIYLPDLGTISDLNTFEKVNSTKIPQSFRHEVESSLFGTSLFYLTESGKLFEIVRLGIKQ